MSGDLLAASTISSKEQCIHWPVTDQNHVLLCTYFIINMLLWKNTIKQPAVRVTGQHQGQSFNTRKTVKQEDCDYLCHTWKNKSWTLQKDNSPLQNCSRIVAAISLVAGGQCAAGWTVTLKIKCNTVRICNLYFWVKLFSTMTIDKAWLYPLRIGWILKKVWKPRAFAG